MHARSKALNRPADGGVLSRWHGSTWAAALTVTLACVMSAVTCAPALAAEACPNEAVREESSVNPETHLPLSLRLPDCRAYELVNPPFTEGFAITGVAAVSANGSQMIAGSLGAFAGTESDPLGANELTTGGTVGGPVYEFTRKGSAWTVSPLDPNPARFPIQKFAGVSSDLSRTLWTTREPTESINALDLELREPDGSTVKVGPIVPPSVSGPPTGYIGEEPGELEVVGTSSDLSRVLFTAAVPQAGALSLLWPGDTTSLEGHYTLYEYADAGDPSPDLVGVNGAGSLISNCETSLGGVGRTLANRYNAVSSNGETVFFTAIGKSEAECASHPSIRAPEVNELYARVNNSKTVAISEPSAAQCSSCLTSIKGPAEFQGASKGGSEVLFTTEQELFAGDTGENLYEYGFGNGEGAKIVRVSRGAPGHETSIPEVEGVVRVSEDGTHVYFVAQAVLVGANREGQSPTEGEPNLYVFERDATYPQGRTAFVATLSNGDTSDWHSHNGSLVQATPDGRFLVFESEAPNLTSDDWSTAPQIFEYDALQEKLVRVSIGQKAPEGYECPMTKKVEEGYNCDGNAGESRDKPSIPETRAGLATVSTDGSYVFFDSADGLTPDSLDNQLVNEYEGAQAYAQNVYEYHSSVASAGGSVADGNVYLISDGRDRTLHDIAASGVELYGTDASGQDAFFSSGDPLVAQDTDTQVDAYDARVDGGFPAPVSPVGCEGKACQGAPSSLPSFGSPASSSVAGGGNLTPPMESKPATKAKLLTREQKLARALRACRSKPKRKRLMCDAQAEKKSGGKAKAEKTDVRAR